MVENKIDRIFPNTFLGTSGVREYRNHLNLGDSLVTNNINFLDNYRFGAGVILALAENDFRGSITAGGQRQELGQLINRFVLRINQPDLAQRDSLFLEQFGFELGAVVSMAGGELKKEVLGNIFSPPVLSAMFPIEPDQPSSFLRGCLNTGADAVSSFLYGFGKERGDRVLINGGDFRNTPEGIATAGLIGTRQAFEYLELYGLTRFGVYYDLHHNFHGMVDAYSDEELAPWVNKGIKYAKALILATNFFNQKVFDLKGLSAPFNEGLVGTDTKYFLARGLVLEPQSFGRDFFIQTVRNNIFALGSMRTKKVMKEMDKTLLPGQAG